MSATPLPIEAPTLRIDDLCRRTRTYLSGDQIKQVRRAYRFGAEAHDGQIRKSGEPYIQHPLAVVEIADVASSLADEDDSSRDIP